MSWECLSCGARAQEKPYCEQCGAAQPVEGGEDSALSLMLGLVCSTCDAYNDPGVAACASCGTPFHSGGTGPPAAIDPPTQSDTLTPMHSQTDPPSWLTPPTGQPLATAFAMPKVNLEAVATGAEGAGVAAPSLPRPTPMPSPAAAAPAPAHTPLAVPAVNPLPSAPAPRAPVVLPTCVKCGTPLTPADKFCRNCGTRADAPNPLSTTQIAAVKLPPPNLPSPMLPVGATMIMPSMRAAQLPPEPAPAAGPAATMVFGAVTAERSAKLILVRGQSQFGTQWRLQAGETVVGRSDGMVLFPDDAALAARHCRLTFRGSDLWLMPEDTINGVFVRVRDPVRLSAGDEVVVGAERLRVLAHEDLPMRIAPDASTRLLGSLVKPAPPIALLRIGSEPALNEVYYRCQRLLTIGRNNCDLNFPRDSFVSERHAQLTHDGGGLVLEDLKSRNGTYVRARGPTQLFHGDLVLLGDKVLRVELPR